MANNDYIAPVDHGFLSATGSVAVGALGGAAKSVAKTSIVWTGISVLAGVVLAVGVPALLLGTGGIAAVFGAAPVLSTIATLGLATVGAVGGAVSGVAESAFLAPIIGLFGAGKGASKASERVSLERGAAKQMEAQIAMYQAAAMAQANDNNKYNFPRAGMSMNAAAPTIQADSVQNLGPVNGQQLQRA